MLFRDAIQLLRQHIQLARQRTRENRLLAVVEHLREGIDAADEARVDVAQLVCAQAIDEQAVEQVQVVIAGGSLNRPLGRQRLVVRENLFDDHIRLTLGPSAAHRRVQTRQILLRIHQPVGMIDPQAGHPAFFDESQHQLVNCREHFGLFHADRSQAIDVEETPIVDLVGGHAPVAEPIRLVGQQRLEPVEAAGLVAPAIHECQRLLDRLPHLAARLEQRRQAAACHFLFAIALLERFGGQLGAGRQMVERRDDALQLHPLRHLGREPRRDNFDRRLEHGDPRARIGRQTPLVITNDEPLPLVGQLQLLIFEHLAELIAQHR